jgi:glycosyltransferase involved in cell wall biosynthesis
MNPELTIIIPSKNEEAYIGKLLESIAAQDYPAIASTKIFVADNKSTDRTREIISSYQDRLNVEVIPGGFPAEGRNNGAKQASTTYVLFMDSDVELGDRTVIRKSLELIKNKRLHCVGAPLTCPNGNVLDRLLYVWANFLQQVSKFTTPAANGTFMLFDRMEFLRLGGFDEKMNFGEDYFLTKQVARSKFGVVPIKVLTGNRQFKRGYFKVMKLNFMLFIHRNDPSFFYHDHGYWATKGSTKQS